jgi:hypothetical protein
MLSNEWLAGFKAALPGSPLVRRRGARGPAGAYEPSAANSNAAGHTRWRGRSYKNPVAVTETLAGRTTA